MYLRHGAFISHRANKNIYYYTVVTEFMARFIAVSAGPLENAANRSQIFEGGVCQGWRCQILEILRVSRLDKRPQETLDRHGRPFNYNCHP